MPANRDLKRLSELHTLPDQTLITSADVALMLGITKNFVDIDRTAVAPRGGKLAAAGIRPVRIGKAVRYRVGDVKKLQPEAA